MIKRIEDFAVYLDMDMVVADTFSGIKRFGFEPDQSMFTPLHLLPGSGSVKKRAMYEAVKGTTFYADLPMMPGAAKLYNFVRAADPIILTASPKFGADDDNFQTNPYWLGAAFHKRNWIETVLLPAAEYERVPIWQRWLNKTHSRERVRISDERFVCTISSRKHLYMHRKHSDHQILIDDRPDNIEPWRENGGIGILHTSVDDTIEQLKAILV